MIEIDVPIVVTIIGEGGSGGALAIGVGDRVLMLEHSVYSVISPEGCASILWDDKDKVSQAADALSLTSLSLMKLGVVDEVVREPLGGAHRHHKRTAILLKKALRKNLHTILKLKPEELTKSRHEKFRRYGDIGFENIA
jgi:acetyl-CoA carboxylase carboxyl transferase subunit alpha